MGERRVQIVFGCTTEIEDDKAAPGEDGWLEWALTRDEGFLSTFAYSYESRPRWMGFVIQDLKYGQSAIVWPQSGRHRHVTQDWERLQKLAAGDGARLPNGYIIVANDQ